MFKIYPDDETIHNTLRMNIRDLAFKTNKEYQQIALDCGISYRTFCNYVNKTSSYRCAIPNALFVIKLADYFNVNPRDLLLKRVCL